MPTLQARCSREGHQRGRLLLRRAGSCTPLEHGRLQYPQLSRESPAAAAIQRQVRGVHAAAEKIHAVRRAVDVGIWPQGQMQRRRGRATAVEDRRDSRSKWPRTTMNLAQQNAARHLELDDHEEEHSVALQQPRCLAPVRRKSTKRPIRFQLPIFTMPDRDGALAALAFTFSLHLPLRHDGLRLRSAPLRFVSAHRPALHADRCWLAY